MEQPEGQEIRELLASGKLRQALLITTQLINDRMFPDAQAFLTAVEALLTQEQRQAEQETFERLRAKAEKLRNETPPPPPFPVGLCESLSVVLSHIGNLPKGTEAKIWIDGGVVGARVIRDKSKEDDQSTDHGEPT